MEENPINRIEQEIATTDTGRSSYLMYKGAREEGASVIEAIAVVSAYWEGMFRAIHSDTGTKKEEDTDELL